MFYRLGLVGYPVAHSLSPLMHTAALAHCSLDGSYELIDVSPQEIAARLKELSHLRFAGLNVTVPHKEACFRLCDGLSPQAKKIGAVNCIKIGAAGRVFGHNTDLAGFQKSLSDILHARNIPSLSEACVLGTGGAARAALASLVRLRTQRIVIVARDIKKAQSLADTLGDKDSPPQVIDCNEATNASLSPQVVVNATTIGLKEEPLPAWADAFLGSLPKQTYLYDMVYKRSGVPPSLVKKALDLGLACCDGQDMLVNQALLSFELWTGHTCPKEVMSSAIRSAQGKAGN